MRIEVRYKKGQKPLDALEKALKVLKKKTAGKIKLFRERNKGFVKPSALRHQKQIDILHKRKIKKLGKNKKWEK